MTPPPQSPLREAHAHIAQHGRAMSMVDLSDCASQSEALERLTLRTAVQSPRRWVTAIGARPQGWAEGAWFDLADLDEAVQGRPACVWCFDQHAIQASSAGLAAAGIDAATPDPAHGVIERRDGRPTGVVLEAATALVWQAVPEPTLPQRREHVVAALGHLAGMGYAEVHEMKSPPWLPALLAELDRAGELPISVSIYATPDALHEIIEIREGWESDSLRLAGAKIFTDGTLNSRTARMLHPFNDPIPDHPRGTPMMTQTEVEDTVRRCDELNLGLAMHAIGDAAVRACLDAVDHVAPKTPGFRIEHAEVIDEADVPRFAQLGVIASLQPCHLLADMEALTRFCPTRLDRVLPIRDLLDSGAEVWFGSDVPIVRADPGDSIQAAVHRRRADMPRSAAIAWDQRITEDEAWAAFSPA